MRLLALGLILVLAAPSPAGADQHPDFVQVGMRDWFDFWPFRKSQSQQTAPRGAGSGPEFKVVSWNMQVFGSRVKADRRRAAAGVIAKIFSDPSAKVLAAQEIANQRGAEAVGEMLAQTNEAWTASFEDTGDSQDNAFFSRPGVKVNCTRLFFDEAGFSRHPARMAHMQIGDFDFTIITLHLAFERGQASSSVEELRHILDRLQDYLRKPGNDPDVIIAGDFNLPSRLGKAQSGRAGQSAWTPIEDVIDGYPMLKPEGNQAKPASLVTFVHDLTSRSGGSPANNYDHFLLTGSVVAGAYVTDSAGRLPLSVVDEVEAAENVVVSDHYPIAARFRSSGAGNDGAPIVLNGQRTCAP